MDSDEQYSWKQQLLRLVALVTERLVATELFLAGVEESKMIEERCILPGRFKNVQIEMQN